MTTTEHRPDPEAPGPSTTTSAAFGSSTGRRGLVLRVAAVAVVAVLAVLVAMRLWGAASPHLYAGTVLQDSAPAPSLDELDFADGSPVDLTAFEGDVVILYFGYTSCPDVCPTTMADAAQAVRQLDADDAERVRLIMISVDPERDPADIVQNYAEHFDASFLGASGSAQSLAEAATQYGIFFQVHEPEDPARPDEYLVDHTSTLLAIDPGGALRVVWSPTVTPPEIAADLEALLD